MDLTLQVCCFYSGDRRRQYSLCLAQNGKLQLGKHPDLFNFVTGIGFFEVGWENVVML